MNVYVGGVNVGRVKKEGGAESVQYFYTDQLGSRRVVTDGSGNAQARIDYSVWGIPTVTNYGGYEGSSDVSYTGKEQDATGLYYFNARYYDASLGRFITEAPVRNGMNWFVYCGNNPLSKTDPTGLWVPIGAQNAMGDSADDQRQYRDYLAKKIYRKINSLGTYGDPNTANGNVISTGASYWIPYKYFDMSPWLFVSNVAYSTSQNADAESATLPIGLSIGTKAAFNNALELIVWRLRGTTTITNYEMYEVRESNSYDIGGFILSERVLIIEKWRADFILRNNADLLERAIKDSRGNFLERWLERLF